jgi:hypothetical protein
LFQGQKNMRIGQQRTAGIVYRRGKAVSSIELNGSTDSRCGHFTPASPSNQMVDWRKVHEARRLLVAGHYDREEVLETVLDAILMDLAEPRDARAIQAAEVGELR